MTLLFETLSTAIQWHRNKTDQYLRWHISARSQTEGPSLIKDIMWHPFRDQVSHQKESGQLNPVPKRAPLSLASNVSLTGQCQVEVVEPSTQMLLRLRRDLIELILAQPSVTRDKPPIPALFNGTLEPYSALILLNIIPALCSDPVRLALRHRGPVLLALSMHQ